MMGGSGLDSAEPFDLELTAERLVAGRPRLPGKTRLKTAPTSYNRAINLCGFFFDLTGPLFGRAAALTPDT